MTIRLLFVLSVFMLNTGFVKSQSETRTPEEKKGQELLQAMSSALLSSKNGFKEVVFVGDNTVYSKNAPGGNVELDTRKAYNFSNQSRRTDFKSPAGPVIVFYENGKAGKIVKGRRSPVRDYEEEQLKNGLQFHYLNIALNKEKYSPKFIGTEEKEGVTYDILQFTIDGKKVEYLLYPETRYPHYIRFEQYSEIHDAVVPVVEHFYDWKVVDGVAVAFKKTTYEKGKIAGEFTYKSVKFN